MSSISFESLMEQDICDSFTIALPEWAVNENKKIRERKTLTQSERMDIVLDFARKNTEEQTGGPFASGVFVRETGRPIVVGVNRVLPHKCAQAHAEMVTLSLAQKCLQSYDLGAEGLPALQLVVNWTPCTMCFGALIWSGCTSLYIPGYGPEIEEITGFDEGPIPGGPGIHPDSGLPYWQVELEKRGIEVNFGSEEHKARALDDFRFFRDGGFAVYNGRKGCKGETDDAADGSKEESKELAPRR